jgi:molecular chaperone GrpE
MADAIDEHLTGQSGPDQKGTSRPSAPTTGEAALDDPEGLQKKAVERDEFLSLLQHTRADYANYQKRVQKEIEATRRFACQPLVAELLPGLDNLERALSAADSNTCPSGLLDGVRMVHQQLLDALGRHGVRAIEATGKPFDPAFHEALLEQPSADTPPHTVLQELQKGYCLHDRVIRPAKVIVAKADQPPATSPDDTAIDQK